MYPYLASCGIRFNDCLFSEPATVAGWTPPRYAGLFAIFVRDPDWAPKPFQPLYFGEFGNNAPAGVFWGNYPALLAAAKGKSLMIAVCPMPYSTTAQRWAVRDELIWAYNPVCQAESGAAGRKHREQNAHAMQPLVEPPAEPQREPRRRIGFMPNCEPAR